MSDMDDFGDDAPDGLDPKTREKIVKAAEKRRDTALAKVKKAPPKEEPDEYEVGADGPLLEEVPAALSPAQKAAMARRNEIQWYVALGCPAEEIARRLGISEETVRHDLGFIRRVNKQRMEELTPAEVLADAETAHKRILRRFMEIADSAEEADTEIKALSEARKTMVSHLASLKQLGITREAPKGPTPPQQHVHKFELPPEVRQVALMAALGPSLKTELAAPEPDDGPVIDAPVEMAALAPAPKARDE